MCLKTGEEQIWHSESMFDFRSAGSSIASTYYITLTLKKVLRHFEICLKNEKVVLGMGCFDNAM